MRERCVALILSGLVAAGCANSRHRGEPDIWHIPQAKASPAQLPRLAQPLTIDGKLDEWTQSLAVPMCLRSQFAEITPKHQWKGAADLSATMYAAWTDQGLAIAGNIRDDQVANDLAGAESYKQDCVELFVDGRVARFGQEQYSAGVYQIFIRPAMAGKNPEVVFAQGGQIKKLQLAGQSTSTGHQFEILIPWSAFPESDSNPLKKLGLAFQADECDAADAGRRGAVLAIPTSSNHWRDASAFATFQCVEEVKPQLSVGPAIAIESPAIVTSSSPKQINVVISPTCSEQTRTVRLSHRLRNSALSYWSTENAPSVDKESRIATCTLDVPQNARWMPGHGRIRAELLDEQNNVLATSERPVLCVGDIVERQIKQIQYANIQLMALRNPYRAASWMGAANCVSRLKTAVDRGDVNDVPRLIEESRTRIELLKRTRPWVSHEMMHDLLVLAADPDAQVVIEYPSANRASVVFNYGAIPLGSVVVRQLSSDAARQELENARTGIPSRTIRELDYEAVISNVCQYSEKAEVQKTNLYIDLFVWAPQDNTLQIHSMDQLPLIRTDSIVTLDNAHSQTTGAAALWAGQLEVPSKSLKEAAADRRVLVIGDPAGQELLKSARYSRASLRQGATQVTLFAGDRLYVTRAPSEEAAFGMIGLVRGGGPVNGRQLDSLRQKILKAIAPEVRANPSAFYTGDMHMHSFYSDGNCSPASLMLQAIYGFQDFSIMTDHNTIAGASRAHTLLAESGFAYPQITGEEFTTKYHSVIFPVTEAISPPMEATDLTRLAHERKMFAQWNHPGFPDWGDEFQLNGMQPLGFDAWEHMPVRYDQWQQSGSLPVLTGSTDTHDGTFGEYPERTIIFAKSADGQSLADAMRAGQCVAVFPDAGKLFYGPPALVKKVCAALAEGNALKEAKANQIREALKSSRAHDLIRASESQPIRE